MQGPFSSGTIRSPVPPSDNSWETRHGLIREHKYRVVDAFVDADGDLHSVGEEWIFICGMFSKFDDQITVCVRRENDGDWKIPLIWNRQDQQKVIENFESYVVRASTARMEETNPGH